MKFDVYREAISPFILWCNFPYFSSLNLIMTEIIKSKKLYNLEDCEKDLHLKKIQPFVTVFEIYCIEETSLHAYFNFLNRSRLQGHVKKKILNREYRDSLQELALKKICRTVFS